MQLKFSDFGTQMSNQFEALTATLMGKLESLNSKNTQQPEPVVAANPSGSVLGPKPNEDVNSGGKKCQESRPEVIVVDPALATSNWGKDKMVVSKIPHYTLPQEAENSPM
ncbi:OLC1v1009119C1 [Oldenlandia corymbosa var. corymbosa]|uniref:OLC1v1009119C1 n=1 Tax=Oldenlandia corymbosa var. corymbosa TaxID=529605 RepID=A0AAV1DN55_OLDCO|nr:OLC1v1009119C1 [Oldenlandia corymbosa var. corymbosa]